MYEQVVMNLLLEKVVFVGTVDGVLPRIRPMQGFIGTDGTLWLLSLVLNKQVTELALNDQVELCLLSEACDLLRVNGILEPMPFSRQVLQQLADEVEIILDKRRYAPDMDLSGEMYQLRVHAIYYTTRDGITFCQKDGAEKVEDIMGIKLIPGDTFQLSLKC